MISTSLSWASQGTFHHVGFVVPSIEKSVQSFADFMDAKWDGIITHDPTQAVRVTFLLGKNAADPLLELIEPAGDKSPVLSFSKKGGGLHHVCYEVEAIEKQLERDRSKGALVVQQPVPAVAYGGRRIAWIYFNRLLIEYLERPR